MAKNGTKALAIVAIVLAGVTALGMAGMGFRMYQYTHPKEEEKQEQEDKKDSGGAVLTPEESDDEANSPLSFVTRKLSVAEYAENGISPLADSAYTITVSYTGTVDHKDVDWSIAWKSGASGQWGNGKTVTEYVSGSASTDTLTFTVTCHQAFGEQIIITATNKAAPTVTKSATVDYARRVTNVADTLIDMKNSTLNGETIYLSDIDYKSGAGPNYARPENTIQYEYGSVYTVEDTFDVLITATVNSEFILALQEYAKNSSYYAGTTKSIIDGLSTFKNPANISGNLKAFGYLVGNLFNSGSIISNNTAREEAAAIFAGFLASDSQPYFFELTYTFTGEHSTYTKTVKVGYAAGAFGSVATADSMQMSGNLIF